MSDNVKQLLGRYLEIIPTTNAAFREHYKEVHPDPKYCDNPLFGCGWYNKWQEIWEPKHHHKAVRAGQFIIDKYWLPSNMPTSLPTLKPIVGSLCKGLSRKKCKNKPETCAYSKLKKEKKKSCFIKNEEFDHDCSQYTTANVCKAAGYCRYERSVGCSHKCTTTVKKRCSRAKKGESSVKICKYGKKPNPCYRICCDIL